MVLTDREQSDVKTEGFKKYFKWNWEQTLGQNKQHVKYLLGF